MKLYVHKNDWFSLASSHQRETKNRTDVIWSMSKLSLEYHSQSLLKRAVFRRRKRKRYNSTRGKPFRIMPCRVGVYRILPNHYILKGKYINYVTYINGLSCLNLAIWASEELGNLPWLRPNHATESTAGPFIADASVARATLYQDPKVSAVAAEAVLEIGLNQKEPSKIR